MDQDGTQLVPLYEILLKGNAGGENSVFGCVKTVAKFEKVVERRLQGMQGI